MVEQTIRKNYTAYNETPMKGTVMFNSKPSDSKVGLENAINSLLEEMSHLNGDSEEYAKMTEQLDVLYKLKEVDHKVEAGKRVSADTLAIIAGNVLGIAMIVGHERVSILTSKALPLLMKLK
ncbi:gp041 [Rhodococcus phage ReqiPoco6]|uniref:Gp041 n=1 Tax=Rhodococcus phage ReqiPoco6 TaxID=691964 RepID=D4P7Q9_9CAUD|nr:gp041 [Rhodococcus phage ReqiPoco6]ADD81039.1 gp041 [Rhodococcus phage ReqiPoco6]